MLVGVKALGGGCLLSPKPQGSSLWDGASQFSCLLAVTPPVVTTMNLPNYKALSDPRAQLASSSLDTRQKREQSPQTGKLRLVEVR